MKIHKMVRDITAAYAGRNIVLPADLLSLVKGLYGTILNFDQTDADARKPDHDSMGAMVGKSLAGMSSAGQVGSVGESIKDAAAKAQKHGIGNGVSVPGWREPVSKLRPAVPKEQSVTNDHISCMECGKKFQMIKRHLKISHDQTPDDYRLKWNLPQSHPMVAPGYSRECSEKAKANGLGSRRLPDKLDSGL